MKEQSKSLQEEYLELQLLSKQLNQVESQLNTVNNQISEVQYVIDSLKEMKTVSSGKSVMVPLSMGIFMPAELKSGDEFLVNIGNDIIVKKNCDETVEMLDEQQSKLIELQSELSIKLDSFMRRFSLLRGKLNV